MASHIGLINFTEQGIRNIKDSPKRAAATELARDFGIEIRDIFWTLGAFDGAVLIEAPDDQAVTARALKLGSLGNVRTQTLRAFRANEFEKHPRKGPLTVGCLGANAEKNFQMAEARGWGEGSRRRGLWGLVRRRLNWELFPSHRKMRIDQKEA